MQIDELEYVRMQFELLKIEKQKHDGSIRLDLIKDQLDDFLAFNKVEVETSAMKRERIVSKIKNRIRK